MRNTPAVCWHHTGLKQQIMSSKDVAEARRKKKTNTDNNNTTFMTNSRHHHRFAPPYRQSNTQKTETIYTFLRHREPQRVTPHLIPVDQEVSVLTDLFCNSRGNGKNKM